MSIFYGFRDIAGYLSKVADFDSQPAFGAPSGLTPVEFRGDLWHPNTRVSGLSCGVVCVILCLAILVELRLVTDTDGHRQTDTDTGPWLVPRMHSIASSDIIGLYADSGRVFMLRSHHTKLN